MSGIKVSDLKAHLSEHLRSVRAGQSLVVLDRHTPIARIIPYEDEPVPLAVSPATVNLQDIPAPAPSGVTWADLRAALAAEKAEGV
jgi:prevent-host-death family protein